MILIHAIKMCHRVGVYAIFVQSLNFSVKLCFSDRCCSQFVTYVCQWCVSDPSICVSSPQPIVWPLLIYWRHFCNGQSWRNLTFHLIANINMIEPFYHSLIVHLSLAEPAWLCENKKGLRTVHLSLILFREVETNNSTFERSICFWYEDWTHVKKVDVDAVCVKGVAGSGDAGLLLLLLQLLLVSHLVPFVCCSLTQLCFFHQVIETGQGGLEA